MMTRSNDFRGPHHVMLSIGFVAANLGVSTSTLRKWEERYGRPKPLRSDGGSRWYRDIDLEALRLAKRRLDGGERAGLVFGDYEGLIQAAQQHPLTGPDGCSSDDGFVQELLDLIHRNQIPRLKDLLQDRLDNAGPQAFIEHTAVPLMQGVGEGWARGQIDVFQEHAAASVMIGLLNGSASSETSPSAPTLLLTTPAGERHDIALNMVCASLTQAGARCVNLGASLPLPNLLAAARAFRADIVGVSISSVNAGRLARRFVAELRAGLPTDVEVWVGGSGAAMLPTLPNDVRAFRDTIEPGELIRARLGKHDSTGAG
jgi:methanogenic corrinoid protein MtbC1